MVSVKNLIPAAAAVLMMSTAAASAADLGAPPVYQPQPMVAAQPSGGWYLRGDIGIGMATSTLTFEQNPLNVSNFAIQHYATGNTPFINAGIGYEFNNWLRFDVTGEYRSRTDINAYGIYTFGGGTFGDQYQGFLTSEIVLANAYIDLGTWDCITPFIGAGIGAAHNTMNDLVDIGIATSGNGIGRDSSSWSPAWALQAGLAYTVTPDFTVELAYRYLNYGSVTDTIDCMGGCNPDSYKFGNLTSQDLMLGMRWNLQPAPVAAPQPISTRG